MGGGKGKGEKAEKTAVKYPPPGTSQIGGGEKAFPSLKRGKGRKTKMN